ncbi:MAG: aminotransferase class III-fold pyridoxal phosphate-dependent enzyme [Rhodopirellula sp. JB053]
MNQFPSGDREIDALAGRISPTGTGDFLADAIASWAQHNWPSGLDASRLSSGDDTSVSWQSCLAERLREVTGLDSGSIATCLPAGSVEDLLQWAIVLCRRLHASQNAKTDGSTASEDGDANRGRILCCIGGDHGQGVVGRMASGRADLRETASPLVPGFMHVPLDGLAQRIDDSIAMVLLSPVDLFDQMRAVSAEQFAEIRAACDQHRVALVIDHQNIPPMGGGHFWVHDSITSVRADAVIMAAGLAGGFGGGVLALNAELSAQLAAPTSERLDMPPHIPTAVLVDATLRQWSEQSWHKRELDGFATALAERLAKRESVRDLHVIGRSFGIELDLPATQWQEYADRVGLRVTTAGEFTVGMQLPLIIDDEAETELLDRMDRVFDEIEEHERKSAEPSSDVNRETDRDDSDNPEANDIDEAEANDVENSDVEVSDVENEDFENEEFEEDSELDEAELDQDELEEEFEDESEDEDSDSDELDEDELDEDGLDEDESGDESDDEEADDDNFDEDVDANDDDDDVKRSQFDGEIAESETEDSDAKTDPENQP